MNLTAERLALLAERLHPPDLPAELPALAEQAALLFEVVSRRYEHGSIWLTSNKSFGE